MSELNGNVLIVQLGNNPAAVMNACLSSLINEVLNFDCVEEVYGAKNGIEGLLDGHFIDMASKPQKTIRNLMQTPGAALGSKARDISNEELRRIFTILNEKEIKFLFILGDNSAVDISSKIEEYARANRNDLLTIFIPFSSINTLPLTDHCLGYGSLIKQLASTIKCMSAENQFGIKLGSVSIIEVAGCTNDWLIAGASLAKYRFDSELAPHITLLPSKNLDEQLFLEKVRQSVVKTGNCVILTSSQIGSIESVSEHIKTIIENSFDVEFNIFKISDWNNSSMRVFSKVDIDEACECAKRAANMMLSFGVTGKMITLLREDGIKYSSEVACVEITSIAGKTKEFPENWYEPELLQVGLSFFKYAAPLIIGEIETPFELGLPIYSEI